MTLDSKSVAVITGASSGIGRALAVRLAKENIAGISISDIDEEGLRQTAELVRPTGVKCQRITADVARLSDIEKIRDAVLDAFGLATHLVNNAGVGLVGRTEEVSFEDIRWLMDINFWGTVYGCKTFLPVMREQGRGHIINVSSVFGLMGPPGQSSYCASKFAVRGFTESLRHELDGSAIAVSCVHPGGIRTNIARDARKGEKAPEEDKRMAPIIFDKICKTTAAQAADVIVAGIKRADPRILIGKDARQISAIQRLFPKRYFKIMDRISHGMLSKFR